MSEDKKLTGKITATLVVGEPKKYIYVEGKTYEIVRSGDLGVGGIDYRSHPDLKNDLGPVEVIKANIGTIIRSTGKAPTSFSLEYTLDLPK